MKHKTSYKLASKIIVYPSMGGWRFLALPLDTAQKIREDFGHKAKGWGSLPVQVAIGNTKWQTSIFPDKKSGTYLLPLKAQVRKREEILDSDIIRFQLDID